MSFVYRTNNYEQAITEIQELIQEALDVVGEFVSGEAKLRCPVDTNTLRSSIDHDVDNNKVYIGANTDYAINVHEGTSRMPKRPFLEKAAFENTDSIKAIFSQVFEDLNS